MLLRKKSIVIILITMLVSLGVFFSLNLSLAKALTVTNFSGEEGKFSVIEKEPADGTVVLNINDNWGNRVKYNSDVNLSSLWLEIDLSNSANYKDGWGIGSFNNIAFTFSQGDDGYSNAPDVISFYIKKDFGKETYDVTLSGGASGNHTQDNYGIKVVNQDGILTVKTKVQQGNFYVAINGKAFLVDKARVPAILNNIIYGKTNSVMKICCWSEAGWPNGSGEKAPIGINKISNETSMEDFPNIDVVTNFESSNTTANSSFVGDTDEVKLEILDSWGSRASRGISSKLSSMNSTFDLSNLSKNNENIKEISFAFTKVKGDMFISDSANGLLNFYVNKNGNMNYSIKVSIGNFKAYQHNQDVFNLGNIEITGTDILQVKTKLINGEFYININGMAYIISKAKIDELNIIGLKDIIYNEADCYLNISAWNGANFPNGSNSRAEIVVKSVNNITLADDFLQWLGKEAPGWEGNPNDLEIRHKVNYLKGDTTGKIAIRVKDSWGARTVKSEKVDLSYMEMEIDLSKLNLYTEKGNMEAAFIFTAVKGDGVTDGKNGVFEIHILKEASKTYTIKLSLGDFGIDGMRHDNDQFGIGEFKITGTDIVNIGTLLTKEKELKVTINNIEKVINEANFPKLDKIPSVAKQMILGQDGGKTSFMTISIWNGFGWPSGTGEYGVIIINNLDDAIELNYRNTILPNAQIKFDNLKVELNKDMKIADNFNSALAKINEFYEAIKPLKEEHKQDFLNLADAEKDKFRVIDDALAFMPITEPIADYGMLKNESEYGAKVYWLNSNSKGIYFNQKLNFTAIKMQLDFTAMPNNSTVFLYLSKTKAINFDNENVMKISIKKVSDHNYLISSDILSESCTASDNIISITMDRTDIRYRLNINSTTIMDLTNVAVIDSYFEKDKNDYLGYMHLSMISDGKSYLGYNILNIVSVEDNYITDFEMIKGDIFKLINDFSEAVKDLTTISKIDIAYNIRTQIPSTSIFRGSEAVKFKEEYDAAEILFNEAAVQNNYALTIEIANAILKNTYDFNTDLDLSGLTIKQKFMDGTFGDEVAVTPSMITGYSKTTIGEQVLTINYNGRTSTFKVKVLENILSSIDIQTLANVLEYEVGQELDLTGLKIKEIYKDGKVVNDITVTSDMISGFDKNKAGKQIIKITHKDKTVEFEITVKQKSKGCGTIVSSSSNAQGGLLVVMVISVLVLISRKKKIFQN